VILSLAGSSHRNTLAEMAHSSPWIIDVASALALFALALATRLPFRSHMLHHWDSLNYALALEHYDVRLHQPQPPGYVLYVALGFVVNLIFRDPQRSYVALSVLCSGLAAAGLYLLGQRMYGRKVGLIAGVFLLVSPSFWFYGEIAMPHTVDAAMVILVAYLAYRVREGEERLLLPLSIALGLAGGVRQQTLLFLLPLCAYCVRGIRASRLAGALTVLIMVSLAWLWPMVHLSGGIAGYKAALMGLGARLWQGTSVFSATGMGGVARNAVRLTKYTAYGWNVMAIPPLLWIARKWRWKVQAITHGQFLGVWIAPPLLFYLLIHMGNPGLVFVYLPALMLASAVALVQLGDRMSKPRQWVAAAAFAAVLVASLQFLALPEHPFGPSDGRYLTRQAIEERDEFLEQAMATIRQDFPADSTIILATQWRHAAYYLPDYLIFGLPGPRIEGQEGSFGAVYINCPPSHGSQSLRAGERTPPGGL